MTLTFTLGAGLVLQDEPDAARSILEAVLGCNVAWGIIDAALLVFARAFDRSRPARLGLALRRADVDADPVGIVAAELDDVLEPLIDARSRRSLYAAIARRIRDRQPDRFRLPIEDGLAALGVFWLVFFSSLPAIAPFLVIADPVVAMRTSNALLLSLLFLVGYRWGRVTTDRPGYAAAAVTSLGAMLVIVAAALGG